MKKFLSLIGIVALMFVFAVPVIADPHGSGGEKFALVTAAQGTLSTTDNGYMEYLELGYTGGVAAQGSGALAVGTLSKCQYAKIGITMTGKTWSNSWVYNGFNGTAHQKTVQTDVGATTKITSKNIKFNGFDIYAVGGIVGAGSIVCNPTGMAASGAFGVYGAVGRFDTNYNGSAVGYSLAGTIHTGNQTTVYSGAGMAVTSNMTNNHIGRGGY